MSLWHKHWILLTIMLCSLILAKGITPHERMATLNKDLRLENAIPKTFGDWRFDNNFSSGMVNPQQAEFQDFLYSQTLTRSYINSKGQSVMLSISYAETQGGGFELHSPEICYVAQGFSLETTGQSSLTVAGSAPPIRLQRLFANLDSRHEPISYWMRVGDDILASGTSQQLSRIRQGFKGWIPDGVLFRVSSLSEEPDGAYLLQESFIKQLFAAVAPATRQFLVGPVSTTKNNTP